MNSVACEWWQSHERRVRGKLSGVRKCAVMLALLTSACAPAMVPAPVVTTPKFPDFVQPVVPEAFANSAAAINERRGWAFLQSGDTKTAEHEFNAALKNDPRFYPAEVSLGYLELARKDTKAAIARFDKVLTKESGEVSALFGRGQALLAANEDPEALVAFEQVLAVDPSHAEARRRVDVLKFRVLEQQIAHARDAAKAGRLDEAEQAYTSAIAGQPDSPFLYRELAAIERQRDESDRALEHLRKAAELDPTDVRSRVQIGEILEHQNDLEGAERAYTEAARLEPNADLEKRIDDLHARMALAKLPAEYRAIDEAPQITRGDLAALIGIRLGRLLQGGTSGDAVVITDVRSSWAENWIMAVARAGVMEPFANHAFQPKSVVRRADLAEAMAKLLTRVAAERPSLAKSWAASTPHFSDLAPGHLAYPAASMAVAAGVMPLAPGDAFQPSRSITGAEAVDAVTKLESLADVK
jgi:tetratricopeptide (TPR) repeat protein